MPWQDVLLVLIRHLVDVFLPTGNVLQWMSHSNKLQITFLQSYQLYYFVEKKRKYARITCTPIGFVDLSWDGVDVLINDIKEHLVKLETINNLLREENQHLRGQNIQNENSSKVEKTNNANNVKYLETKIKKLQTELFEANRNSVENIKEINRLKHQLNIDTGINGTPNIIDVSINEDMNIRRTMVMTNVLLMTWCLF